MEENTHEILTVGEAAELLRISRSAVYALSKRGELPAQKVGRHWRFHRATLIDWIARRASSESGSIRSIEEAEEGSP
jgi:excisionase family DNA binding protein